VVSGNPKQHLADRTPAKVNLHHQAKKPMELYNTNTIPTGQILISKCDKVKAVRAKKVGNCARKSPYKNDHKVLIIDDSHIRNCAANIKYTIKDNFEVQGVVKPGAGANILANSVKNKVRSLSKNNIIVFCGVAIDVGRNNSSKALHQITNFITDNKHTNIILTTAPHTYDLTQDSCVNNEITSLN
jgi:hypothetical protein